MEWREAGGDGQEVEFRAADLERGRCWWPARVLDQPAEPQPALAAQPRPVDLLRLHEDPAARRRPFEELRPRGGFDSGIDLARSIRACE